MLDAMNYLIPAILALVGSVITGVVLWLIKRTRRRLVYSLVKLTEFKGGPGGAVVGIHSLTLANRGNVELEDTEVTLTLDAGGEFVAISAAEPELIPNGITTEKTRGRFRIPLLNPGESTEIAMTVGNPANAAPKVVARARGVTAVEEAHGQDSGYFIGPTVTGAITVGVAILGVFAVLGPLSSLLTDDERLPTLQSKLDSLNEGMKQYRAEVDSMLKGKPEREQELFVLFNAAGVGDLYPQYLAGGEMTYWRAGYFLFTRCVSDGARCRSYIRAMDRLLEISSQQPSSRAFNLYLAARMERMMGGNRKADIYLDRLKNDYPLMFDYLMREDASLDIEQLRRGLVH